MPMEEDYVSIHTGNVIDGAISAVINGRAGLQGVYLNGTELEPDGSNKVSISLVNDYYDKTSIDSLLNNKVDKVTGKGLSTEDFTSDEKTKLANIETEANKTIVVQTTGSSTTDVMSQNATTTELNSKATVSYYTATLYANSWSGSTTPYTQRVNINGILVTDRPIVGLNNTSEATLESWSYVSSVFAETDSLLFECYIDKPTTNLNINIMVVR